MIELILQGICPQWLVQDSRSRHDPRPEYVKILGQGEVKVTLQGKHLDCKGLDTFLSRAKRHTWDGWAPLARRPVKSAITRLWEEWE